MENLKILKLPYSENYIQNRIDNFYREFLSHDHSHEYVEQLIAAIHDYLLLIDSGESIELTQTIINLRQSIYWLNTHYSADFDIQD
jgi:hypothetical protein